VSPNLNQKAGHGGSQLKSLLYKRHWEEDDGPRLATAKKKKKKKDPI
jgi:hypothetical protein